MKQRVDRSKQRALDAGLTAQASDVVRSVQLRDMLNLSKQKRLAKEERQGKKSLGRDLGHYDRSSGVLHIRKSEIKDVKQTKKLPTLASVFKQR